VTTGSHLLIFENPLAMREWAFDWKVSGDAALVITVVSPA
jgi:hypothetical protein